MCVRVLLRALLQVAVQPCNHQCLCLQCAVRLVPLFVQGVQAVQACAVCRRPICGLRVTADSPTIPSDPEADRCVCAASREVGRTRTKRDEERQSV